MQDMFEWNQISSSCFASVGTCSHLSYVRIFVSGLKTGTGTVIIQVEDVNDNMPTIPAGNLVLCQKKGELGSLMIVAEDKDQAPFSSPFTFSLPQDNDGKWSLTRFNGRCLCFHTAALSVVERMFE